MPQIWDSKFLLQKHPSGGEGRYIKPDFLSYPILNVVRNFKGKVIIIVWDKQHRKSNNGLMKVATVGLLVYEELKPIRRP